MRVGLLSWDWNVARGAAVFNDVVGLAGALFCTLVNGMSNTKPHSMPASLDFWA